MLRVPTKSAGFSRLARARSKPHVVITTNSTNNVFNISNRIHNMRETLISRLALFLSRRKKRVILSSNAKSMNASKSQCILRCSAAYPHAPASVREAAGGAGPASCLFPSTHFKYPALCNFYSCHVPHIKHASSRYHGQPQHTPHLRIPSLIIFFWRCFLYSVMLPSHLRTVLCSHTMMSFAILSSNLSLVS